MAAIALQRWETWNLQFLQLLSPILFGSTFAFSNPSCVNNIIYNIKLLCVQINKQFFFVCQNICLCVLNSCTNIMPYNVCPKCSTMIKTIQNHLKISSFHKSFNTSVLVTRILSQSQHDNLRNPTVGINADTLFYINLCSSKQLFDLYVDYYCNYFIGLFSIVIIVLFFGWSIPCIQNTLQQKKHYTTLTKLYIYIIFKTSVL